MLQDYMIIDGKKYTQGTIFIMDGYDGVWYGSMRTTFLFYDTEYKSYCFITPTLKHPDKRTYYSDTRFMKSLAGVDTPNEKEVRVMRNVLQQVAYTKRHSKRWFSDEEKSTLLLFGMIVLFAALPPVGLVLFLCIVFSGGTTEGFIGCLIPILVLVFIALITML